MGCGDSAAQAGALKFDAVQQFTTVLAASSRCHLASDPQSAFRRPHWSVFVEALVCTHSEALVSREFHRLTRQVPNTGTNGTGRWVRAL